MKNKMPRRKVEIKNVDDISVLGQMTKDELLLDSEKFDPENYNPLENIEEKIILIPDSKSQTLTLRLSSKENEELTTLATQNGLNKSVFVRQLIEQAKLANVQETTKQTSQNVQSFDFNILQKLNQINSRLSTLESYNSLKPNTQGLYFDFDDLKEHVSSTKNPYELNFMITSLEQ